jgi:rRNA maturation protein Nop10
MTTMGDVPDKVGYKTTVGAPHRFSALDRVSLPKSRL